VSLRREDLDARYRGLLDAILAGVRSDEAVQAEDRERSAV
jgi:hypothetical protein